MSQIKPFNKVMVANRGEIAIRIFRACTELGIGTVAIYSEEDRLHLHRYKADEAYQVGKGKNPINAYLHYDEILDLAVAKGVDAIHPGYGFLAENAEFAKACAARGVKFIGPSVDVLENLGDKVFARHVADRAGVPTVPGTPGAIDSDQDALLFAKEAGFPLIVKAALGGGGRGMSIVNSRHELLDALAKCRQEAATAFGNPKIFLEKYLLQPKHIEVQIMGDEHGNLVHLFERDCSIQRRHQKVVEIGPSLTLTPEQRQAILNDAIKICSEVNYYNAGTVEFLVDAEGKHYFIEVNPRIQVEHTVTEMITGYDLVQTQIRVAEGHRLDSEAIRIPSQEAITCHGYCIQLRLTTEDPTNNFAPGTGKITTFRPGEGFGIRLDAGSGFDGAEISAHYDSLLIKVCAWALDFDKAADKALRAIREFRIRGVPTNIPFLENVLRHPDFLAGRCDTTFVDTRKELFTFKPRKDRANKLLSFLGEVVVNGFPNISTANRPEFLPQAEIPAAPYTPPPVTPAYAAFTAGGAEGLSKWMLEQKQLMITDTTFRDAHQSLVATRVRSYDLNRIAGATGHLMPQLFSSEMWGGATFDVSYRFLHENPWERLRSLRKLMPGTLLQMLIRSANAVGYTNYPDNVVKKFIQLSAAEGIDIFRIFDSLNWVEAMKPSIAWVAETGKIAEAAICYSGDITDGARTKFTLPYYVNMAKELEAAGAHILAIKDMAGLIRPEAARILVTELKQHLSIPIHLHTHDTSGNGVATLLEASRAGVDVVDTALSSMSGMTSQPSMNALVCALDGTERQTGMKWRDLQKLADYWEITRLAYSSFECGLKAGTADVYHHEIPGGQYSNFRPQAISMGLASRWEEVKDMYRTVNDMLGEIIKVTPSSKAVGDMALFMVQNDLQPADVIAKGADLAYPDSFLSLMRGMMGQPDGGFPAELQKAVLGEEQPITCRPGDLLDDFDFAAAAAKLEKKYERPFNDEELVSYALYEKVFTDYTDFVQQHGDVSVIDTPTFFFGMKPNDERAITIEAGKTLIVKLLAVGNVEADGTREVFFELNGRRRYFNILDKNSGIEIITNERADLENPNHIAAPMSGVVVKLHCKEGDVLNAGDRIMVTEAMKMLNVITTPKTGKVARLLFKDGHDVNAGDLVAEIVDTDEAPPIRAE